MGLGHQHLGGRTRAAAAAVASEAFAASSSLPAVSSAPAGILSSYPSSLVLAAALALLPLPPPPPRPAPAAGPCVSPPLRQPASVILRAL